MTEAQGPFFQEGSTGKPTSATAVTAFAYTNKTVFDDIVRRLQNQHRSWLWYKGLNADLLDSLHAAYLTTAVNEDDVDHPDLNDTLPAAPSGGLNVKWQAQATQNSDSQTPVSAYVPFSSLSIVTAVAADYVVITDTSDSANPKRALVSDITALVAPTDAQYVTLATNATLSNERVLTAGTAVDFVDGGAGSTVTINVDLSELGVGTPAGADAFPFIDADDSVAKLGNAADTLAALGAASSTTAVTQAAATTSTNAVFVGETGNRARFETPVIIDKSNGNTSGVGTLASGAHTETVANVTASNRSGVDSTKGPWRQTYFKDMTTSGGGVQTVMDVPIPTSCSATIAVRLYTIAPLSLNRVFLAVHELHVSDNAGTPTIQLDQPVIDNDPGGIGYAISFIVSTTNVRIQINDATNTLRLGCSATIEWRNATA